jgi:hypothetical protein
MIFFVLVAMNKTKNCWLHSLIWKFRFDIWKYGLFFYEMPILFIRYFISYSSFFEINASSTHKFTKIIFMLCKYSYQFSKICYNYFRSYGVCVLNYRSQLWLFFWPQTKLMNDIWLCFFTFSLNFFLVCLFIIEKICGFMNCMQQKKNHF